MSRIEVTEPYLTVAGQTAPGDGITITNDASNGKGPLRISTHDVVLRYLRVRSTPSSNDSGTLDSTSLDQGTYNVVVDHCSFSWGTDEVFQTGEAHDFTIQWSIIAEGLYNSTHPEGDHSKGMHFRDENSNNISVHHNLLAHNYDRNPNINTTGVVDLVNNVFYNAARWTEVKDKFGEPNVNIVNNYYKQGPNSEGRHEVFYYDSKGRKPKVYVKGNLGFNRPTDDLPEELIVAEDSRWMIVNSRFPAPPVTTVTASKAFGLVLANVGATLPVRDANDTRVVNDVRNGTGWHINDPSDVGGWLRMAPGTPPADTDHDGMPDQWEQQYGFNATNPADGPQDADGDGYTNVEEYLNGTNPRDSGPKDPEPKDPEPKDPEPKDPEPKDPATLVFTPIADATIKASSPNNNYGSSSRLEIDGEPKQHSLMKFSVQGIGTGKVTSAKLRLFNVSSSDKGGDFYRTADSRWSEQSITWNNAPKADSTVLASLRSVTSDTWYEVDITSLITGDGVYSLRVQSTSKDGADYSTREEAGFSPQLVITVAQ